MGDIFGEIFRSMFGIPRREYSPDNSSENFDPRGQDGFPGGGPFSFFPPPFFGGVSSGINSDTEDEGFSDSRNPRDPFGFGMDIFGHIQEIFEGLGIQDMPHGVEGFSIGPAQRKDDEDNLRDKMLKEPHSEHSLHKYNPFNGGLFRIPDINIPDMYQNPSQQRTDTDLDEEVKQGNLDAIFGSNDAAPSMIVPRPDGAIQPSPGGRPYKSFKSVSVHTYRNANGQIEERKTIQDGRGNKETIITRSVEGQRHTVTKRRDHDGTENVTEQFDNMDESEKDNFDSKWNSRHSPDHGLFGGRNTPRNNDLDPETKSIFHDLFGKGFPGFGAGNS